MPLLDPDSSFAIKYLDKKYVLVSKTTKSGIPDFLCCSGEINYSIYKSFLLVEVPTGGSVRRSLVMLYKLSKKGIRLVDLMSPGNLEIDFVPALERTAEEIKQYGASDEKIVQMVGGQKIKVADYDKDDKPEMIVIIDDESSSFEKPGIKLYISFDDNGFKLNKNPELYKPLYKKYAHKKNNVIKKYIYSTLSRQRSFKPHLKKDTINYIQSVLDWDRESHNGYYNRRTLGFIKCK